MQPEVTVVVPTLDRPALLALALASALAQRDVELEAIVVDDGSAQAIHQATLPPDPRVRLLRHGEPRGMAAARNAGLHAARGPWVAFLDDDDAWAPDKLRRQLQVASRDGSGFAYGGALAVGRGGDVVARVPAPAPEALERRLLEVNVIPAGASNVVARTELLRELGGFDATLPHFADWDLWIRLAAAARASVVDDELVAYRYHAGNRSFGGDAALRADFEVLAGRYARRRAELGVTLDRVDFERFLAWTPRHQGRRLAAARAYLGAAVRMRDPGSAVRAAGMLLGERAMRAGAGRRRPEPVPPWAAPFVGG